MRNILFSGLLAGAFTLLVAATATADTSSKNQVSREVDVIRAVGVVRYFHPHDAVTEVDWNRVLMQGFSLAEEDSDDAAFAKALAGLLGGLGEGISHHSGNDAAPKSALDCPTGAHPVRWVHEGFAFDPVPENWEAYRSWRSGVANPPGPFAFSTAIKNLPAEAWRNQQLVFSSEVRLPEGGEAALLARINDAENNFLHFDDMAESRIVAAEWSSYSQRFDVAEDAERIGLGLMVYTTAVAEFRNIRLQRIDQHSGEPAGESLLPDPGQWRSHSEEIAHTMQVYTGEQGISVRLVPEQTQRHSPQPMPESLADAPGRTSVALLDGSLLQVPLVLCPQQVELTAANAEQLATDFPSLDIETLPPQDKARLDVAVAWPVMQHFYPYREQIAEWSDALATALVETRSVADTRDHQRLLQRLMAHIHDSHVRVYLRDEDPNADIALLPLAVESVDGELVVSRVEGEIDVQVGDRIVSIDDEPAAQWLERELTHQSGSLGWRTFRVIGELLQGPRGDSRKLGLQRDDQRLQISLPFEQARPLETFNHPPSSTLDGGVIYVNLSSLPAEAMAELMADLAHAPGVVFDLRGYPRDHAFLTHLLESPDDFQGWMRVMHARAPDGELVVGGEHAWALEPAEPHIEAPVVLLTNHRAISWAESIVGLVKHHGLATVVGSNTAGANGNVAPMQLPGGANVYYTGMHVLGPDGEPFHAKGIEPDIHVVPTMEGLKEGRDEVLERALALFE